MTPNPLDTSRALWNRDRLDLGSDEILAQLLDRGDLADWRALYRLALTDAALRGRIKQIVYSVALPLPHFWMAVLKSMGEEVDFDAKVPSYGESSV